MANFSWQPTHSQAIVMAVGTVLLVIVGTVVIVAHGHLSWFFALWYLAAAVVLVLSVRRIRATRS